MIYKNHILFFLLGTLIIFFIFFKILKEDGFIFQGDFLSFKNVETFKNLYSFLWDSYTSSSSMKEIVYRYPFKIVIDIFYLFKIDSSILAKLMIILPSILSFTSFYLSCIILFRKKNTQFYIASLIGGLFYSLNINIFYRLAHFFLLVGGYSLFPLFVSLVIKFYQKFSFKYMFFAIIIWVFASFSIHFFVFYFASFSIISFVFIILKKIKFHYSFLFIILFILVSSYWVIPYFYSFKNVKLPYILTEEVLNLLSRDSNILNVIFLTQNWWRPRIINPYPNEFFLPFWILTTSILFSLIFSTIFINKKESLIFLIITLIGINIVMGTNALIINYVYIEKILPSSISWIFRDPDKFSFLIAYGYSYLLFLLIYNQQKLKDYLLISIIIFLLILIYIYPTVSSSLNSYKPVKIPSEFHLNDNNRTLVLPYITEKTFWAPENLIRRDFYYYNLGNSNGVVLSNDYYNFLIFSIRKNKYEKLEYIINLYKINKIILRKDFNYNINFNLDLLDSKIIDKKIENLFSVYFLKEKPIFEVSNVFYCENNIDTINIIKYKYFCVSINENQLRNYSDIFLINKEINNKIKLRNNNIKIQPFDYSFNHNPYKFWSKSSSSDPLHGEWHSYLEKWGMENWDSDYGYGLVFTWSPYILNNGKIKLNSNDIYYNLDYFNNLNTKNLNLSFYNKNIKVEIKKGNEWGWKIISTDYLEIKPDNWYQFKNIISGKDVKSVHSKVIWFDENRNEINTDFVFGGIDGTFDSKELIENILSPTKAKYMKVQFWVWQNNETDSYYIIKESKVYDLSKYVRPNDLEMNFKINKNDNYHLFIRYFKNEKGGSIKVFLDEREISINTSDQLNKFVWEDLGEFNLTKGKHKIVLRNIQGFNAVNLFVVIPSEELKNQKKEFNDWVKTKKIIYIFEAESDLYNKNSEKIYIKNSSNGEVLNFLNNGEAWNNFDVPKTSYYKIAIRYNGNFTLYLDKNKFELNQNNPDFQYIEPIYLSEGNHSIKIESINFPKTYIWEFKNEDDLIKWKEFTKESNIYKISLDENENSLKTELYDSTWGWKLISSPLIPVKPNEKYKFNFYIKGENAEEVHFKIMEFNSSKQNVYGIYAGYIGSGNFSWKEIKYEYTPKNETTAYLQLQIWHGHETKEPLPNIVSIKNVTIEGYSQNYLDVIWLYEVDSFESNETIEDIFKVDKIPAEINNYAKINPTLWKVYVNSTEPFMLSFAESYDPGWEARVYKDGKVETVKSIPLYGVINGFWINTTGENLEIVIRYKPQDYFELGLAISGITFFSCIGYLIYDWKRDFFNDKFYQLKARIKKQKYTYKPKK